MLSSLTREPLRSCSPTPTSSPSEHAVDLSPRRSQPSNSLTHRSPSHTPLVPTSPRDTKPTSFPSLHCDTKTTSGFSSGGPPFKHQTQPTTPSPRHSDSLRFNTTGNTIKIRRPPVKAEHPPDRGRPPVHPGGERSVRPPVKTEHPPDRGRPPVHPGTGRSPVKSGHPPSRDRPPVHPGTGRSPVKAEHSPGRERTGGPPVEAEHPPDGERTGPPPVHPVRRAPVKAEHPHRDPKRAWEGMSAINTRVRPQVPAPMVKSLDSAGGNGIGLLSPNSDHDKDHKRSPTVSKASHITRPSEPSCKFSQASSLRTPPNGICPSWEGSVREPIFRASKPLSPFKSVSKLRPDHSSCDTATPADHHRHDDRPLNSPVCTPKTHRERKRSMSSSSLSESKHRHPDTSTRVQVGSNHASQPLPSPLKSSRKRHRRHSLESFPGPSNKKRRHSSSGFPQSPKSSPGKRWKLSDFVLPSPRKRWNLADFVLHEHPDEDSSPNGLVPAHGSPKTQRTSIPHHTPASLPQVVSGSSTSSPHVSAAGSTHPNKDVHVFVKNRDRVLSQDRFSSLTGIQQHFKTENSASLRQGSEHSPLARHQSESGRKRSRHSTDQLSPASSHKKKRRRFNSDGPMSSSRPHVQRKILEFIHALNQADIDVRTGPDHKLLATGGESSRMETHPTSTQSPTSAWTDPALSHEYRSLPKQGLSSSPLLSPGSSCASPAMLPVLPSSPRLHESSVPSVVGHHPNHFEPPSFVSGSHDLSPSYSSLVVSRIQESTSPYPSLSRIPTPQLCSDPHSDPFTSVTPTLPASLDTPGPLPSLAALSRDPSHCVPSPPSSPIVDSSVLPCGGNFTTVSSPVSSKGKAPLGASGPSKRKKCLKLIKSPSSPRFTNSLKNFSCVVKLEPKPQPHLADEEQV